MKSPVNIFDAAYLAILPAAAGIVGYKMWRKGKYRESGPAMLGRGLASEDAQYWKDGCVWIHAVSVGEVIAARAMLPLLRQHFSSLPILLTTHTETGQAVARALPAGMVDAVRYYPLDLSWIVRKYVDVYKPKVFILMETELWPNALDIISASGAQVFTLNGKISENSYRNYQKISGLIRRPLSRITAFCVQTQRDHDRIAGLLGHGNNIHVTGNCKFDVDIPALDDADKAAFAGELGISWPSALVVAGSTHPGEETIILNAFQKVVSVVPRVRLAIVPRHPERFSDVWDMVRQAGLPAKRLSDGKLSTGANPSVYLVDMMGVLTRLYGLAEVAIVAGSFVPGIGGHNILEPAAHGTPVIYGSDMSGQPDMAKILSPHTGGTIATGETLADAILELLQNQDLARAKGEQGRAAWIANRGSAERNMAVIRQYLKSEYR